VGAAACVAVTLVPPTATDRVRAAPGLDDTTTRNVASPRPLSGETDAHATPLLAVHEHSECVCTAMVRSPPPDPIAVALGVTWYWHAAASCSTVICRSTTAITPLRVTGSLFADTRNPTVPSPWPLVFDVIAIHDDCDAAVHVQSRSTVMDTLPAPPVAANLGALEDTFA
jgi:hypothetical protein